MGDGLCRRFVTCHSTTQIYGQNHSDIIMHTWREPRAVWPQKKRRRRSSVVLRRSTSGRIALSSENSTPVGTGPRRPRMRHLQDVARGRPADRLPGGGHVGGRRRGIHGSSLPQGRRPRRRHGESAQRVAAQGDAALRRRASSIGVQGVLLQVSETCLFFLLANLCTASKASERRSSCSVRDSSCRGGSQAMESRSSTDTERQPLFCDLRILPRGEDTDRMRSMLFLHFFESMSTALATPDSCFVSLAVCRSRLSRLKSFWTPREYSASIVAAAVPT